MKYACGQCKRAKERKRARLDREEAERDDEEAVDANDNTENNNNSSGLDENSSDDTNDDDDVSVLEIPGKKRKRSGEHHSHCHCPLYKVTDEQIDFVGGALPYRRFKAAQEEKRKATEVDRIITVQRKKLNKPKYEMDMKKELLRFKQSLKIGLINKLPTQLQVGFYHVFLLVFNCVTSCRFLRKLWRRKEMKGERGKKNWMKGGQSKIVFLFYSLYVVIE